MRAGSAEIQECMRLGEFARKAGALAPPKAGDSSFGPTGRNVERKRAQQLRQALVAVASLRSADNEKRAIALGDQLLRTSSDARTCLSAARAALQATGRRGTQRLERIDRSLDNFANGPGQAHLHVVQDLLPSLPLQGLSLVPAPGGLCFELSAAQAEAVTQAAAWALGSKEANAGATLRQYWEQLHRVPVHEEATSAVLGASTPSVCRLAGFCMCSDSGRQLAGLQASYIRALKRFCPPLSDMRQHLINGRLVARFVASPADDDLDAWLEEDEPQREVFFHLGRVRLSPFRTTLQLLDQQAGGDGFADRPQVEFVKATSREIGSMHHNYMSAKEDFFRSSHQSVRRPPWHRIGRATMSEFSGLDTSSGQCCHAPTTRANVAFHPGYQSFLERLRSPADGEHLRPD